MGLMDIGDTRPMEQVWIYTIQHQTTGQPIRSTMTSTYWRDAESVKRFFDEGRSDKIEWEETPQGSWIGKFRHQATGDRLQLYVYPIQMMPNE